MINKLVADAEVSMIAGVEHLKETFAGIRTSRANSGLFEKIIIDYYGTPTPLKSLANINVADARSVIINPFDKGAVANIEKGLRESDLGVNPNNDGGILRVNLPELTKERRQEYVRLAKGKAEDAKVAIRNIRRNAKQTADKAIKDGELPEDDGRHLEKLLDAKTKQYVDSVDEILAAKTSDLLLV